MPSDLSFQTLAPLTPWLVAAALVLVVLANDLMTSFKPLLQLFAYGPYHKRKLPVEIQPYLWFAVSFIGFGVIAATGLLRRRMGLLHIGVLTLYGVIGFYISVVLVRRRLLV